MNRIKAVLIGVLLPLVLSSCSGERLHDMTIVQAVGVDKGTPVSACIQYLDLNRTAGSSEALEGNITATQTGKGATLSAALNAANRSLAGEEFFGQNKLFVLGKDYAATSLPLFTEYLRCSRDSRPDVLVAMSDTTAEEVLKSEVSGARVPSENMVDLLKSGEETAQAPAVSVNDVLCRYYNAQSDVFLPVFTASEKAVVTSGIAVFSEEKLVDVLQGEAALGFMLADGRVKKGTVLLAVNGRTLPFEIVEFQRQSHIYEDNGKLRWHIALTLTLYADSEGDAATLRNGAESSLSLCVKSAVEHCLSLRSDPFGISLMAAKETPSYYALHRVDWRSELPEIAVDCDATVTLLQ